MSVDRNKVGCSQQVLLKLLSQFEQFGSGLAGNFNRNFRSCSTQHLGAVHFTFGVPEICNRFRCPIYNE